MVHRHRLLNLGCVALLLSAGCAGAPARPVIVVEASYAGANAQVLADTVAVPIEQEVNGVEKLLSMRSRCTNDGRYVLSLTFADGIDAALAQVLVQNRVALAVRLLPAQVQAGDVTVKTKPAGVLLIVSLSSPEGRFDTTYLGNYAAIQIKDELARLGGVGSVSLLPERDDGLGDHRLKSAQFNGKDVALLVIAPTLKARPREVTQAVTKKLALLEKHLPKGLHLELAFDFTTNVETPAKRGIPEYLLLDVDLPNDAAPERPDAILARCEKILRDVNGVKDVLTLTDNPFDGDNNAPCILVRLIPASERKSSREEIAESIRTRLPEKLTDATVRLRAPLGAGPLAGWGYPVDLAIHGPKTEQVRKLAVKLAERMRQEKKLMDVWLDRASELRPGHRVDINREQAAKLGVKLADIQLVLEIYGAGAAPGKQLDELKQLKIRNDRGDMVALSAVVTIREITSAATVDRLDSRPMVQITANPAPGTSVADARALCESLFRAIREEQKLPDDYRLSASPAK